MFSRVVAILNNCRVIVGSLWVTYNLLQYSMIFMQRCGGVITTSLSIFDNYMTMCEFSLSFVPIWVRSAESPINGHGITVKHSFSLVLNLQLTLTLSYRWRIHCHLLSCVLACCCHPKQLPSHCGFTMGYVQLAAI